MACCRFSSIRTFNGIYCHLRKDGGFQYTDTIYNVIILNKVRNKLWLPLFVHHRPLKSYASCRSFYSKLFNTREKRKLFFFQKHLFSSYEDNSSRVVDLRKYEAVSEETLESLSEYFEEILENENSLSSSDVSYSSGVLTINLGSHGTYVINKQTPNRQIWLSSPLSGPKRYDFVNGHWIYKRDGISLHELLNKEIPEIIKLDMDFTMCTYGKPME